MTGVNTTRAEVCRYAATRLRDIVGNASPLPWTTSGLSNRYGGIIAPARPGTPRDEVDGYGGELVAESVLAGNGNLILTLSHVALPILAILDAASGRTDDTVTDAELALARTVLDAGEVGWTSNRRPSRDEVAEAVRVAAEAEGDPDDDEFTDAVSDAWRGGVGPEGYETL